MRAVGDEADAARDAWYATPWGEQQRLLREEPDDVDLQCHPCPHGGVHGGDYCRACEQNTGENEGEAYCRTDHDELRRELYGEEGRTMGEEMAWVNGRFSLGPGGTVIDHNEQDRNARTGQGNGANMTIDIRGSKLAAVLAAAGVDRDEVLTELGALLTGGEQEETSGRWPAEPPVGSVLKFEHSFPHRDRGEQGRVEGDRVAYTYLALRVGDGEDAWYTTANRATSKRTMSWPALGKFIGDAAKVELATGWFEIPALVEPEPAAPVSAQDWIAANFGGGGTASGSIEGRSEEELRNGANRMRAAEQL